MSLWTLLDDGWNRPVRRNWRHRLLFRIGRWLARHPRVHVGRNCLIHPDAKICPRDGEIFIGDNTLIAMGTCIQGNVTIGSNCSVQMNGNIVGSGGPADARGRITIGDDTRVGANCMMVAANHVFSDPDLLIRQQGTEPAPITVGPDIWLGGYVKIVAGVTIGRGSVVGMGAVVSRDIPEYSVAVGVPARVVRSRRTVKGEAS